MTKWSGFVENQGFKSDFYSDRRGGVAYLINNNLQIDASISTILKIHQRCMEVLDSLCAAMATTKKRINTGSSDNAT
jgi:hypothetical protein